METTFLYSELSLRTFCTDVFLSMGCSEKDALTAADVLVAADLCGVDSHGVARLIGYLRLHQHGRINPTPKIKIVHQNPSTASIDADAGLGLVVAPQIMEIAIDKSTIAGSAWISVMNSNHFGIAGYHASLPLEKDMIGMAMTNASPLVAPTLSAERLLGTNLIAVAIPAGEEPPFVADFATTTVANGKLEILSRKGLDAPIGWIQDAQGKHTTKADALKSGGALLPLGGERANGSHKGYCLGAWVDIFSAVLSGAAYGPWAPPFVSFLPMPPNPPGKGLGHFFGAMRVDGFRPVDEFKFHMDQWIRRFRTSTPSEGQERVLIPGDPERETTAIRKKTGIPLLVPVIESLKEVAKITQISADFLENPI